MGFLIGIAVCIIVLLIVYSYQEMADNFDYDWLKLTAWIVLGACAFFLILFWFVYADVHSNTVKLRDGIMTEQSLIVKQVSGITSEAQQQQSISNLSLLFSRINSFNSSLEYRKCHPKFLWWLSLREGRMVNIEKVPLLVKLVPASP